MEHATESVVSQASISARAEALEKKEAEAAAGKGKESEEGKTGKEDTKGDDAAVAAKAKADKEASDKAAAEKADAEKKAAEDAAKAGKGKDKKAPNDPEELRKWNVRTSQENAKLRKEMAEIKEAQEKTYKLLASLSKKPIDYKELAKNPENVEKFIEEERQALTEEYQEELSRLANESRAKDTLVERMKREHDSENYPEWKRLYPSIVKIAMGPTGSGDPRVDFTKPASEVLDQLYEIALQENPKGAEPVTPEPTAEKTFTEAEVKAMVADMVSKERESISKAAREDAAKEAQEALKREAAGGTVASSGRGASRVPTDQLAAFKKMSLSEQRDWLIAQQQNA